MDLPRSRFLNFFFGFDLGVRDKPLVVLLKRIEIGKSQPTDVGGDLALQISLIGRECLLSSYGFVKKPR